MIMQLSFSLLAISTVIAGAISFEPPQGLNAYLAAHPISVTSVNETRQDSTLREQSPVSPVPLNRCPVSCAAAGTNSSSWTVYHDLNHLSLCNESMLVDFALYNPVDDEDTHLSLHACTSASEISKAKRGAQKACPSPENPSRVNSTLQLGWSGSNVPGKTENGISAVQQLQSYVQAEDSCNEEIAFAYSGDAVVGLYAGSEINGQDITGALIEQFLSYVQSNSISGTLAAQLCASTGNYSAKYAFGLILNTNADWASVQQAVRMWRDADCITKFDEEKSWHAINYLAPSPGLSGSTSKSTILNSPTPYANGTCATYKVVSGDICATIAATYDITAADIENYNNNTWGWMGCSDLQLGQYICLSSGYPPMPANVPNAVCGPQMNNTPILPPGTDFSTVNESPLNACCDIWGQCGTTGEFCTVSNSSTGAPGTAAKGQNGCISNCGTDIVYSDPPAEFIRVGYFEGYNWQRPCLSGSILSVNTSAYTHIHLAFATLNSDFSVNITSLASNFDLFASLSGVKKIISFGGWEFSTSSGSYEIFREAVQGGNRQTFINNVINLIDEYNLDGVDFDWEYPGEPDIPGIPPSSAVDAFNFYVFLADLHAAMGSNTTKSVSMTAPASFWYLQNLAIEAISEVVDYIVFMTYDLHGQWDYGAAFSDPGCPAGNCLRSDVNLTETINALSMITKAGVPSNKVVVGVTSYGRSFQMTTPGCYTEMCTYTGPDSGAIAGSCTQTAGYLGGGEIDAIVSENTSQILQYVDDSFSNILVYDNDQWVSYMDADNKETRTELYQSLNFAGTADWAVDLQSNGTTYYVEPGSHDGSGVVYVDPSIWTDPTPIVECIPPCSLVMPPLTLPTTTTVSIPATSVLVTVSTPTSVTTTWGSTTTVLAAYSPMTIGTVVDIPPCTFICYFHVLYTTLLTLNI
jgi:chitinase